MRDEKGMLGVRRVGEHWGHTHRIPSRTRDALDALKNNSSGGERVPARQGSEDGMRWNGLAWHGMASPAKARLDSTLCLGYTHKRQQ